MENMNKPKTIKELFEQWELEDVRRQYAVYNRLLKEIYADLPRALVYADNPFLKVIKNDPE
jgi:hypothetical protein